MVVKPLFSSCKTYFSLFFCFWGVLWPRHILVHPIITFVGLILCTEALVCTSQVLNPQCYTTPTRTKPCRVWTTGQRCGTTLSCSAVWQKPEPYTSRPVLLADWPQISFHPEWQPKCCSNGRIIKMAWTRCPQETLEMSNDRPRHSVADSSLGYIEHDDGYGSSNHVKPDGRGNMGSLVTIKIIKMYCMAKKQVNNNYKWNDSANKSQTHKTLMQDWHTVSFQSSDEHK